MSAIPDPVGHGSLLPSGTVTFAFTDIEGSTQRWERAPAAMHEAIRRHDALVRTAIVEHGGYVFKTIGDAFCASFRRPEDALAAMLASQRALAAADFAAVDGLRVRAAVHTGTADERDGDYFGPVVNRVARLLATGHGGQVLVSGATAGLVRDVLPPTTTLRDLGEHRLKDLSRPERVYQLAAPDLPAEFRPLRSLDAVSNNLPAAATSFVGREAEIADITTLLNAHRLVTLVGSGGLGKTRTSLQVAANVADDFASGVWFVELAPLSNGDYVPSSIAQATGVALNAEGDPVENLADALRAMHALLVFDNCEHVIEAVARIVAAILRKSPNIKILASSRQGLGVTGEMAYRLPTLGVPSDASNSTGGPLRADEAQRYAAVALFVERARAVDQRFALADRDAPVVAEICRRLDGIPLAIELAAARVKILSPRQLGERLDERFRVLTGGARDVLPRQQTLRALIDWSYDLLDARESALFRHLGIFVNGFTLEGAAAIGVGAGLDELDAFDVLSSLVDKSLVLAEPDGPDLRYRLLESTRVYASEKLTAAGERSRCASLHLQYLLDLIARGRRLYDETGRRGELVDVLTTELEDVRAALAGALNGDAVAGGRLLAEIGSGWANLGLDNEGIGWDEAFSTALADSGEPRILARMSTAISVLKGNTSRVPAAFEAARRAVVHARTSGNGAALAEALWMYGYTAARLRDYDTFETALAEAEAMPGLTASVRLAMLQTRASVSLHRGDHATAAHAFEELRSAHRALGNQHSELTITQSLAEIEHMRGRTRDAIAIANNVLPALRTQSDRGLLMMVSANLAAYSASVGDLGKAFVAAREALQVLAGEPDIVYVAIALEHLALALALAGNFTFAAMLAGYVDAALPRLGFDREYTETTTHDRLVGLLRERLTPEEIAHHVSQGEALAPETAVALALDAIEAFFASRTEPIG